MKPATTIRLGIFAVLILGLEAACRAGMISRFAMVPPSAMVGGLVETLSSGEINGELGATFAGIAIAAVSAIIVGFVVGVLVHAVPRVRACLDPLLATYYSIPTFVFYPMLLVFFGMNRTPIVIIGFLFAVVAMITSTFTGLDRIPSVFTKTARVLRLSRVKTTIRIVLPAAAPHLFTGAKLAIVYSFVGVIGSEFILSNSGLGYEIAFSFNNFDNARMYALIVLVILVVGAVNALLFAWERSLLRRWGR